MLKYSHWLACALVAATLSACGGGGGGDEGGGGGAPVVPVPMTAPPLAGSPTAVLAGSQQGAAALVAVVKAGAAAMDKVDGFSSLPLGVQVSPPTAVTTTDTEVCSGGGNVVGTFNVVNANAIFPGDTAKLVFSNCVEFGITTNGMIDLSFTRVVSEDNFASSFTATDLVVSQAGLSRGPASFTGQVDYANGVVNFAYAVDGVSVLGSPSISRTGNNVLVTRGVTRNNLGSGFVESNYNGWAFDRITGRASAGSATVTAANGRSASVSIDVDGYHVTINADGMANVYVVPF